jgi:hypothetical protein
MSEAGREARRERSQHMSDQDRKAMREQAAKRQTRGGHRSRGAADPLTRRKGP